MAEEMMDDGSGAAEGNINVAAVEAADIERQAQEEAEAEVEGVVPEASVTTMAQEDMRLSESAVANSVGEKQIRIDLVQNEENLIEGKIYIGTPGKPVSLVLDTGSEHMAVASDLCSNCPSKPYSLAGSSSNHLLSNDTNTVTYGSAEFTGKETEDRTCMA